MEGSLIPILASLACCGFMALVVFAVVGFLLMRRRGKSAEPAASADPSPQLQQDMDASSSPFASAGRAADDMPEPVGATPDPTPSTEPAPEPAGDGPPPVPNDPSSADLPPDPSMPRSKPRPPRSENTDRPPPLPNSPMPPSVASAPNRTIVPFDLDEYDEDAATVLFTRPTNDEDEEET